jgi:hypothetical protein
VVGSALALGHGRSSIRSVTLTRTDARPIDPEKSLR